MAFIVTPTGTAPDIGFGIGNVVLQDLGGRTLLDLSPSVSVDLELEYSLDELSKSNDLQTALDNGWLTAVNENGVTITQVEETVGFSDLLQKNEGQVRIDDGNGIKPSFSWSPGNTAFGVFNQITYTSPLTFGPGVITQWPENISSPTDSDIYNAGNFVENTILGQVNIWRMIIDFTGKSQGKTVPVILRLENTLSGFSLEDSITVPSILTAGEFFVNFTTIADSASLPSPLGTGQGYVFSLTAYETITLTIASITRFNYQKNPR